MSLSLPTPFGRFDRIVFEDFEFSTDPTNRPDHVLAYCARDLIGRGKWEIWKPKDDPCPLGDRDLLVAYASGAELGCRSRLGWSMPKNVLCLHAEYCREVAGLDGEKYSRRGLLDALRVFGILHPYENDKERLQQRALDPSPFSADERKEMLAYCYADVTTSRKLFEKMLAVGCWKDEKELGQALLRGRFVKAQRMVEGYGIPVDAELWDILQTNRENIRVSFIDTMDRDKVYEDGVFKEKRFQELALRLDRRWPRTPRGAVRHDKTTLKTMGKRFPEIENLRQLGKTLSALREPSISIHNDRAYCYTAPFKSKTGRNQPSTSRFLFGAPKWMRSLIKPTKGRAIAYVDVVAEEFGIAALLSQDNAMWGSYCSDDVYIDFAKRAGLVPPNATKATHPENRRMCKEVVLGVQYGRGSASTSLALNITEQKAYDLHFYHKSIYHKYWSYINKIVEMGLFRKCLLSVLGWRVHIHPKTKPQTIQNFPMQAGGAELMRAVTITAVESGIRLIAQVHDAFVIEADQSTIDAETQKTRDIISKVSASLFGKPLKSSAKVFTYPERYIDEDAGEMLKGFDKVLKGYGYDHLLVPKGKDSLPQTDAP